MANILKRISALFWPAPKSLYRIACIYENGVDIKDPLWLRWPELFGPADALINSLPEASFLRSVQYDPKRARPGDDARQITRFRKLKWNERNNRRWVEDLAHRPGLELACTEIWSPWVADLEERRSSPHFYAKIDGADSSAVGEARDCDWQSLTFAIRHDLLADSGPAAQRLVECVSCLMPKNRALIFDRSWGEHGLYTSFIRVNGLEDSYPGMLQAWLSANPDAAVAGFDTSSGSRPG